MDSLVGVRAVELMSELRSSVAAFNSWWVERVVECVVFPIALYVDGEVPDQIGVGRESGAAAVALARRAFAQFDRVEEQHPVSVMRLPGYVVLNEDPVEQVSIVNQRKGALRDYLKEHYPAAAPRTKACRRLFPGALMHQVYRQIPYASPEIARVSFHWSPSTTASKRLTPVQAIELIAKAQQASGLIETDLADAFAIALKRVATLSNASPVKIVRRTPVAPHPRVALFEAHQGKALTTYHANVPLLFGPADHERGIRQLNDFDATRRKRARGRPQLCLKPLCLPLYLYSFSGR